MVRERGLTSNAFEKVLKLFFDIAWLDFQVIFQNYHNEKQCTNCKKILFLNIGSKTKKTSLFSPAGLKFHLKI
jgi:hypothetical protein